MPAKTKLDLHQQKPSSIVNYSTIALLILYVTIVLSVDTLISARAQWPFPWVRLDWHLSTSMPSLRGTIWSGFDLFKFVFWLLVPLSVCLPGMNWRYLLWGPWKKRDLAFVSALAILGMAAMFLIPLVPALTASYLGHGTLTAAQKMSYFQSAMVWNVSWLIGWEFMHRYLLLGAARIAWPRWGWLLVPLSETLYHLQKAGLEALGMMALSVVLTLWCMKRGNWLIGFVVHLIIEVELLIFLTMIA